MPVEDIPDGVRGWSWGAFLLTWIWAIGNRTWIGLLTLVPYVGIIMAIMLGIRGREWAWKNKKWDSVEHFNRVQRQWSMWGIGLVVASFVIIGVLVVRYPWTLDSLSGLDDQTIEAEVAEPATEAELNQETDRILADAKLEDARPSFDCNGASNDVEHMICGSRELSQADVELAQAYQEALTRDVDKDALREGQDEWRRNERDVCTTYVCIVDAYDRRLLDLHLAGR